MIENQLSYDEPSLLNKFLVINNLSLTELPHLTFLIMMNTVIITFYIFQETVYCVSVIRMSIFSQVLNILTSIALDHVSLFKNVLSACWYFANSHTFLYQLVKFH